jgi:uncharacterized protein (DUF4415 family)
MKKETISKELADQLARLDAMREEDIDTSDIPSLGDAFWQNVRLRQPGETKEQVTIRLPAYVLRYFRKGGKGYQTRISQVLEHFVESQQAER